MQGIRRRMAVTLEVFFVFMTAGGLLPHEDSEAGRVLAGAWGLRDELRDAQLSGLPSVEGMSHVDAGEFLFDFFPDDPYDMELLLSLASSSGGLGFPCAVTLFEDPVSRETVILDAEGAEILRMPPDPGYDPLWAFYLLCPGDAVLDSAAYDPANVSLTLRLLISPFWQDFPPSGAAGDHEDGETGDVGASPGPGMSGDGDAAPAAPAPVASALSPSPWASVPEMAAVAGQGDGNASSNGVRMATGRRTAGYSAHTVYVDRMRGCDSWSGRSELPPPDLASPEGPKRTIRAGLSAGGRKENLVIKGGNYSDDIRVRGRPENVLIQGDVQLMKCYEDAAAASAAFSSTRRDAPPPASSNAVARATE